MMVFGEGLPNDYVLSDTGQHVNYFAGALDVVAHELTHGVMGYTSNLEYLNESGALNESFSDMMGTSAEFYYQTPGPGLGHADYLIAEDVITPGGIRSMSDPASFGDPDHYTQRFQGSEDNGGVHTNSAIPNQVFYLAIEGGTNRTSGLSVQGVGGANREQIEKAFYRAFTQMLPSNATFHTARTATIQSARDLYGAGSPAETAVTQAWTALGVN
jgi:bacillolysin